MLFASLGHQYLPELLYNLMRKVQTERNSVDTVECFTVLAFVR